VSLCRAALVPTTMAQAPQHLLNQFMKSSHNSWPLMRTRHIVQGLSCEGDVTRTHNLLGQPRQVPTGGTDASDALPRDSMHNAVVAGPGDDLGAADPGDRLWARSSSQRSGLGTSRLPQQRVTMAAPWAPAAAVLAGRWMPCWNSPKGKNCRMPGRVS